MFAKDHFVNDLTQIELTISGTRYNMPGADNNEKTEAARKFLSSLPVGAHFILARRPDNAYNPDAVACVWEDDGNQYGFVSDEQLFQIKPYLDEFDQCDATLTRTDGHITYYVTVEIPANDIPDFIPKAERVLADCPLLHKFMLESQPRELKMDVLPQRFVKIPITIDNLQDLYHKADILLDCFNVSLCRSDGHWQRQIQKKIEQICNFVHQLNDVDSSSSYCNYDSWQVFSDKCRDLLGDYHRRDGHGIILQNQFNRILDNEKANKLLDKVSNYYQEEFSNQMNLLSDWFKSCMNMPFALNLDWQELGHTMAYKKLSRPETYEILTVMVLLQKFYSVSPSTPNSVSPSTPNSVSPSTPNPVSPSTEKPKKKKRLPRPPKKVEDKEHGVARDTFTCAKHITGKHLDVLLGEMKQDGWLTNQTSEANFRALFSGKASPCEIVMSGTPAIGTLKEFFNTLKDEELIEIPEGARSVNSVIENHVVDTEGHFVTDVNDGKVATSSFQTIQKYVDLLKVHIQQDNIDKMFADLEVEDPSYR